MSKIIFAVPQLTGGVYDYCNVLKQNIDMQCEIVQLNRNTKLSPDVEIIYLHYSGYGYEKRGTPLWLLDWIKQEKRRGVKFGVFFHELYAFGPVFSSSFWLSPVQRYIASRIAKECDFWITNRVESAEWLKRATGENVPYGVLSVFSNVGEVIECDFSQRKRIAVVFGGESLRESTYKSAGSELFTWARDNDIVIHDIGPKFSNSQFSNYLESMNVIMHGKLSNQDVHLHLSYTMFGLVQYPLNYITKSSVFAAYCANKVLPLVFGEGSAQDDGLMEGAEYILGLPRGAAFNDRQKVADNAWAWYQTHAIERHVDLLEDLLRSLEKCSFN